MYNYSISNTIIYGKILNQINDFIILSLLILFISGTSTLSSYNTFAIIVFVYLLIIFLVKKLSVDKFFLILLFIWVIINGISVLYNGSDKFSLITFLGFTLRIIMSYLMVKILGNNAFDKFYKYAYRLAIIASVIYIFNILFPSYFRSLSSYLNFMTPLEQKLSGGWYIFVYMYSSWASPERNCGFMWEPGAFAFVLIFLTLFNLLKNNFKFNKQFLILLIILITTYSTAGYIAAFIILVFITILQYKTYKLAYKIILPILLVGILFGGIYSYRKLPFLQDEINIYLENIDYVGDWEFKGMRAKRVNRIAIAKIEFEGSLHWPFGNGIIAHTKYVLGKYGPIEGPNSLADILRMWGWLGIVSLIYGFRIFVRLFTNSKTFSICFILAMGVVLFSNPFVIKYLIYGIVFYAMINRKELNKIQTNE